jgi:hypothetical protein
MSNLVVSNISDGTTSVGTGYVVNGSAKAWVNFNATGTQTINDSLNVSSLTDGGVGFTQVTFASGMASSFFAATHGASVNSSYANAECSTYGATGSYIQFVGAEANVGYDKTDVSVVAHGDLA